MANSSVSHENWAASTMGLSSGMESTSSNTFTIHKAHKRNVLLIHKRESILVFLFLFITWTIRILRSVRITHAGSSSYIVLNHLFLHTVSTNLPEVWPEVLSEVGLKFSPRLAQGFCFLVPKSPVQNLCRQESILVFLQNFFSYHKQLDNYCSSKEMR